MFHGQVEGTDVVVLDPRFKSCFAGHVRVERLWTGSRWAEGPAWFAAGRYLVWSDIPNNRLMRYVEPSGEVSVFRENANNANGNTVDNQGRLVTCEHLSRSVTRTDFDGRIRPLATHWQGKRLNSPNDVVVTRDGAIWFTDPPFGLLGYNEGEKAEAELGQGVYRLDPHTLAPSLVMEGIPGPNGLAFSPDETTLYIVASRADPREIRAYDVIGGTKLARERVLIDSGPGGTPDGFRVDLDGNLWCGWGMGTAELDGVRIFNPDGAPIGHIALPERCANLCFGGRWRNRLFMAASHSLYSLIVNTQGVAGG